MRYNMVYHMIYLIISHDIYAYLCNIYIYTTT